MYAINHAATGLLIKKKSPAVPIIPILVSTQLIEILWVVFNFLGIEHFSVVEGKIHLDFLPYSHSVFSTVLISIVAYAIIRWGIKNKPLALPFSIGVISHVILDILFHEKDILLWPWSETPVFGFGIITFPLLNFVLETLFGLFCWWFYKGSKRLLMVILLFNLFDLPVMLAEGRMLDVFVRYPYLLPMFILFQILITWYFVARFSREGKVETV